MMSSSLINRSEDLSGLKSAGYRLEIRGAYLIVRGIPYISHEGAIKTADIVSNLDFVVIGNEEVTAQPDNHTVWWTGDTPYYANGESMENYLSCGIWEDGHDIGENITVSMQWSRKIKEGGQTRGYKDYKEKIETYIDEVAGQADSIKLGVLESARGGWDPTETSHSRFEYLDTNAYRNGLKGIESRIEDEILAVVGVGGTGSYLVDILAKTNVKEVRLFDDDVIKVHNAFRVAGAARVEELGGQKKKVDWHVDRYGAVRKKGLHVHKVKLDETNFDEICDCTTVFIAVDDLATRRNIQSACTKMKILHVSVGIGLEIEGPSSSQIGGMVKVETNFEACENTAEINKYPHDLDVNLNVYRSNIQTAELNMLGAALAIAEWKAKRGIYRSDRDENNNTTIYSVTTGEIVVGRKGKAITEM